MKKIYLIRHAESKHNKESMHIIGGRDYLTPLTDQGREQATLLGKRLQKTGIKFDSVYSSIALRTIETAQITCANISYPIELITYTKEIAEMDSGDYVGRVRAEVYTPELKEYLDEHSWEFTLPNGESQKMVAERMKNFLNTALEDKINQNIALFTHGIAIRTFLCSIMEFHPRYVYQSHIENTSISEIHKDNNRFWIKRINDYAHLEPISV